jgi:hypothetical protein
LRNSPPRRDLPEDLGAPLNEVPVALDLPAPLLDAEAPRRSPDVGRGIGAVTACLRADAHEVIAIEPTGPDMEDIRLLQRAIDVAVEALEPSPVLRDAARIPSSTSRRLG